MTVTLPNGNWAKITAPPGTRVGPLTFTPIIYTHLNGTWNFVMKTKHGTYISGTITFTNEPYLNPYEPAYHFTETINGEILNGTYHADASTLLDLCYKSPGGCADMAITKISPNYIEASNADITMHLTKVN
jgi:hypothetical protein